MQYHIEPPRLAATKVWPVFQAAFEQFLFDQTETTFHKVVRELMAVSYIVEEGRAISMCFHRAVSCENYLNPPEYFKDSPVDFLKKIQGQGEFLTIEWMAVHPDKLGRFTKVQPVDLILGSGLRFMQECGFQGGLGFSRQDIKTDRVTERFGTKKMGEVQRFGLNCSLVLVRNHELLQHPIARTQEVLNQLWNQRTSSFLHLEKRMAA